MAVMRYDLTAEQAEKLGDLFTAAGFKYVRLGSLYYHILILDSNGEGNLMVGRLQDNRWLEIYPDNLPEDIEKKVNSVLRECGLLGEKPRS